jgi:hypothetical protein
MDKNSFLTGQPIFTQLLNFIPRGLVAKLAAEYRTDRYYKKFRTYDHLVTMLYTSFHGCNSLREVTTGMLVAFNKLNHLGLHYIPRRSTLADANSVRNEEFFGKLYHELYKYYYGNLPDSRLSKDLQDRLYIIDSTTIKLFSSVMEGLGRKPVTGKQKGGAKAHVLMKSDEDLPCYILITHACKNDKVILDKFRLEPGSIVVFDRAYNNFKKLAEWKKQGVIWVTRLWKATSHEILERMPVTEEQQKNGVIADEKIRMGRPSNKQTTKVKARKITYLDAATNRMFEFVTNNMKMTPSQIASIYKRRWQIEMLFKRIKQSYQLKYFLGDNENAVKIQIWCALITDLLVKIVKDKAGKKWSYANIASMIRLHLMSYVNLFRFLRNPEKALVNYTTPNTDQLMLYG